MSEDRLAAATEMSPEDRARVFKVLRERALAGAESPVEPRSADAGPIPLAPAQHRLWLMEQLYPGTPAYTELSALAVSGDLDVALLERSFSEIVRRHEVLRTTFSGGDGDGAVQVVAPPHPVRIAVEELRGVGETERAAALERRLAEESGHVFALARGPLLRVTLLRTGERESVLLVAAHHIVLDGWSIAILRRELSELYAAFAAGGPSPLPELPVQYADFALWSRDRARGETGAELGYWTEQLAGLPPLLQLPVARPRPEVATFRGARRYFRFGPGAAERLRALSQGENVTLFTTLLAAFQLLLHRYTGQADLAVGVPEANRGRPELEDLVGFFVNTLVMRADLAGAPTTRELLRRVGRTAAAALDHRAVPFESVVEALQPERSTSYHPLCQVMFDFQNTRRAPAGREGFAAAPLEVTSAPARFDLLLSMEDAPDGLRGYWQYSTDLFDAGTVERMTGHLRVLLEGMAAAPDRPAAALPLLTPEERREREAWNRTEAPVPRERCIHELIGEQLVRTPHAAAVSDGRRTLTCGELDRRADAVADALAERGAGRGARVAIVAGRSVEVVAGILGILRAGAAYVPLDPAWPRERLAQVLADAKPAALLAACEPDAPLPEGAPPLLRLDALPEGAQARAGSPAGPDDLAYVVYTSGSTGAPKGVMVTHASLVASTAARAAVYPGTVGSFLLLSPLAVDSAVAGIFWTLADGGRLVLPPEEIRSDPAALWRLAAAERVTHTLAIPSLYAALLEVADAAALPELRTVVVAGESCPRGLVEEHLRRLPGVALYNEYGPTEATVWATVHRCDAVPEGPVPIGRPIPNARCHVLDAHGQAVPVGVVGELYVAGEGVARGYLGRPELTAERFVVLAGGGGAGERAYRTGDLARYREDGALEFLGRADRQVKVRGFRLELDEVEAALAEHPGVVEAAAAVVRDGEGGRLVAWVAAADPAWLSTGALRDFIADRLPAYAVPSALEVLAALPHLPGGKLDRLALPAPSAAAGPAAEDAEWSQLERDLAVIFRTTLKLDAVGREDNFFKIGGDSLLAIRVYNRLRGVTDREWAITDFFKYPTIRALAAFIESQPVVGDV